MAITQEEIFLKADEIDATGQNPTLSAVRKALGGGSFTTISNAMGEWKLRKAAKALTHSEPAPAVIQDKLTSLGMEVWAQALAMSNGRLDAERQALEERKIVNEAARQEAAELADQVTGELEAAKQRAISLQAERDALQVTIVQLKDELAKSLERTAQAQTRASEIALRVDDLNTQLTRVSAQNSELVAAVAQLAKTPAAGNSVV